MKNLKKVFNIVLALALILAFSSYPGKTKAAALTVSDIVSNNQISATSVTHTVAFTTVTALTADSANKITVNLAGSTITANTADVWTDGIDTPGTPTFATTIITIPFSTALAAGTLVTIVIDGNTNPATAGDQTTTAKTYQGPTPTEVDTGTDTVTYVSGAATQNVKVGKALELTITGGATHQYIVDPVTNKTDTNSNTLTVRTNADSYTLKTKVNQQLTKSAFTIAKWTGTNAAPTVPSASDVYFGYNVSGTNKPTQFTDATYYAGFETTDTAETVMSDDEATGNTAQTITVTYKVSVDWTIEAGDYTAITTYTVAPIYN